MSSYRGGKPVIMISNNPAGKCCLFGCGGIASVFFMMVVGTIVSAIFGPLLRGIFGIETPAVPSPTPYLPPSFPPDGSPLPAMTPADMASLQQAILLAGVIAVLWFVGILVAPALFFYLSRRIAGGAGRGRKADELPVDESVLLPSPPPDLSATLTAYLAADGHVDERTARAAILELAGAGIISAAQGRARYEGTAEDDPPFLRAIGESLSPVFARGEEVAALLSMGGSNGTAVWLLEQADLRSGPPRLAHVLGHAAFERGYLADDPSTYRLGRKRATIAVVLTVLSFLLVPFAWLVAPFVIGGVLAGLRRREAAPHPATAEGARAVAMVGAFANSVEKALAADPSPAGLFGADGTFPDVTAAAGLAYLVAAGREEAAARLLADGLDRGPDAEPVDWQTLHSLAGAIARSQGA